MSVNPESIRVGKCYLMDDKRLRRVLRISSEGRVHFVYREDRPGPSALWWAGMVDLPNFAASAQREVPCDWTPETDE